MNRRIFSEATSKLRSKVIIFSTISLFMGITEKIPHNFTIIGLKISETDKTLGWFILAATLVVFFYFLMNAYLEFEEYNLEDIIQNKARDIKCELTGITEEEYYHKSDYQIEYEQDMRLENMTESDSFHEQRRMIKNEVTTRHIKFRKYITFVFEFVLPVILAMVSIYYLCPFLTVSLT